MRDEDGGVGRAQIFKEMENKCMLVILIEAHCDRMVICREEGARQCFFVPW